MIKKNKGYKFRLKPNKEQSIYLEKAFGCSRKMYNIYVDMLYSAFYFRQIKLSPAK